MSKMSRKTKTTHTYSIDDNLYLDFCNLIEIKMLNKSKVIENLIKKWIEENKNKL